MILLDYPLASWVNRLTIRLSFRGFGKTTDSRINGDDEFSGKFLSRCPTCPSKNTA